MSEPDQSSLIQNVEKINLKELSAHLPGEKRKNKSLFALNLERQGKLKSYYALNGPETPQDKGETTQQTPFSLTTPGIISGEGIGNVKEVEQIHKENVERLSKMNPEEILSEQQKLVQQLDPKILAFIRKRNKTDPTAAAHSDPDAHLRASGDKLTLNKEDILNDLPIKPDKKWLNMNKIEYEKLEWMIKPKSSIKNVADSNESASARFDFAGNLISPGEDVPVTKALHHHGNDPDSAGYTLDELFHLARSKFNQQRVLAIQTLANILSKCHQVCIIT